MSTGYYCYVSSQTDTSEAKGIAIFDVEPDEGRLILRKEVELDNPIHMATSHDGRFLYAITDKGVASFEILPGGDLKRLNIGSIRGLRGCNISISPDDRWLFVSGHYDAKITVLEVNTDGSVGRIACGIFHKGLGVTERDFIPHVRCATTSYCRNARCWAMTTRARNCTGTCTRCCAATIPMIPPI